MEEKQVCLDEFIKIPKGSYRLLIEYTCKECNVKKTQFGIVPKFKCPTCGLYLEATELEGEKNTK